jgi:hypothetical protein
MGHEVDGLISQIRESGDREIGKVENQEQKPSQ